MTIVIPEELVPLLRDGLYFDLHGQLEEAGALVEPRGRADISDGVAGCFNSSTRPQKQCAARMKTMTRLTRTTQRRMTRRDGRARSEDSTNA
jgi:hypothetical protein